MRHRTMKKVTDPNELYVIKSVYYVATIVQKNVYICVYRYIRETRYKIEDTRKSYEM